MKIHHFEKVDISNIEETFSQDMQHRFLLEIPFLERPEKKTLCVFGQNPSKASKSEADKTVRFIEEYVFSKLPEYSSLLLLNLFTRVDTRKEYISNLIHPDYLSILQEKVNNYEDFLIIFGKIRNQDSYNFTDKAKELEILLKGKNVFKLDSPDSDYAPHPGNAKILYRNFTVGTCRYNFEDLPH